MYSSKSHSGLVLRVQRSRSSQCCFSAYVYAYMFTNIYILDTLSLSVYIYIYIYIYICTREEKIPRFARCIGKKKLTIQCIGLHRINVGIYIAMHRF